MSLALQILNYPTWISVFLTVFLAFYLWKKFQALCNSTLKLNLPPGPKKLPVIGNLHQLVGQYPHRQLASLAKKYGPVMHLQLGEISMVVISSPEAAKEALTTHELSFANRPTALATQIMSYNYLAFAFSPYGEYWKQARKMCVTEILSPKCVRGFRSIREEEMWNMIQSLTQSHGVAFNLSAILFTLTNNISSRTAFGEKFKGQDQLLLLAKEARKFTGGFNVADLFPSLGTFLGYVTGLIPAIRKLHRKLDKVLDDIINDHKAQSRGGDDMINYLLKLSESGQLGFEFTNNHIKAISMDLLSGGSETSSATIEWAMTELVRNPRVMEKVQAELREVLKGKTRIEEKDMEKLDYLRAVVKETLRFHPPGTLIPRETKERFEFAGYDIPAKTKAVINVWAIGRDQDHWSDADCFKPERFLDGRNIDFLGTSFEYLPFGGGRRVCPGISFALSIVELALCQLLYHFDWNIPNGGKPEELDATELFGLTSRRKNDLYLVPMIRVPFHKEVI